MITSMIIRLFLVLILVLASVCTGVHFQKKGKLDCHEAWLLGGITGVIATLVGNVGW